MFPNSFVVMTSVLTAIAVTGLLVGQKWPSIIRDVNVNRRHFSLAIFLDALFIIAVTAYIPFSHGPRGIFSLDIPRNEVILLAEATVYLLSLLIVRRRATSYGIN